MLWISTHAWARARTCTHVHIIIRAKMINSGNAKNKQTHVFCRSLDLFNAELSADGYSRGPGCEQVGAGKGGREGRGEL